MEMVKGISDMQQAATNTQVGYAVAAKVMKTTSALQMDLINQMMGEMGIGNNLNTVA